MVKAVVAALFVLAAHTAKAQPLPSNVVFDYTIGKLPPTPLKYTIYTTFNESVPVSVSSYATWLSVTLSSSLTPATLTVAIKPEGLPVGSHTSSFTVLGERNSITVVVVVRVAAAPVLPSPVVYPESLTFRARAGRSTGYEELPKEQSLRIVSSTATEIRVIGQSNSTWLQVGAPPPGSFTPTAIPVSINASPAQPPGTYSGSLSILSGGSSVNVPVTLIVEPPSASSLTLSPANISFNSVLGQDPPEQSVSLNSSGPPLPFMVSNPVPWLITQTSGTTPATLTLRPKTAALTAGDYKSTLTITSGFQTASLDVTLRVLPDNRPTLTSVLSTNNSLPVASAGAWVTLYGRNLAPKTRTVSTNEISDGLLPKSLDGVTVWIGGQRCPIYYLSPTQVNVLVPIGLTGYSGNVVTEIATAEGRSSWDLQIREFAPGAFQVISDGKKLPAATFADGSSILSRPARPGDIVVIYGSGFGATSPLQADGAAYQTATPLSSSVEVNVGGQPAKLLYAGLVGTGLYQCNIEIPAVTAGNQEIVFTVNGVSSPPGLVIPVVTP